MLSSGKYLFNDTCSSSNPIPDCSLEEAVLSLSVFIDDSSSGASATSLRRLFHSLIELTDRKCFSAIQPLFYLAQFHPITSSLTSLGSTDMSRRSEDWILLYCGHSLKSTLCPWH